MIKLKALALNPAAFDYQMFGQHFSSIVIVIVASEIYLCSSNTI